MAFLQPSRAMGYGDQGWDKVGTGTWGIRRRMLSPATQPWRRQGRGQLRALPAASSMLAVGHGPWRGGHLHVPITPLASLELPVALALPLSRLNKLNSFSFPSSVIFSTKGSLLPAANQLCPLLGCGDRVQPLGWDGSSPWSWDPAYRVGSSLWSWDPACGTGQGPAHGDRVQPLGRGSEPPVPRSLESPKVVTASNTQGHPSPALQAHAHISGR